jgi:hypothetical protein
METSDQFNLNEALLQWRSGLKDSPAFRPDDLEELEGHLRDSISSLVSKGLSDREAFWVATSRIGTKQALDSEFGKLNVREVWLDRALWMVIGSVGIQTLSGLSGVVATTATIGINAIVHKEQLVGLGGAVLYYLGTIGLILGAWRSGTRSHRLVWQIGSWMKAHPISAGVTAFLLIVFNSAGQIGSSMLAAKVLQLPAYSALMQWRSIWSLPWILLWPCVLAWLLTRAARKPVLH